jgi:ubiquinol-cytochrome c reductase cytochrome b subunit
MLALALLNGFSGYSMPDDLLSGTGLRIIYSVTLSIPVVGPWITLLVFGDEFPGELIVPRLFVSHVLLVPAALVALISVHLAIIVRQKHTQFPGPGRRDRNVVGSRLWPAYVARSLSLLTGVFAVVFALGGLVQINPVWIYGPFHPAQVTSPAQPDWYVAWGDGALRLFPPVEFRIFGHLVPAPFLSAVGLGTATFLLLYAWPWLERWSTGDRGFHHVLQRPRERPWRVAIGAWALTFFAVLLVAAADDIIARLTRAPITDLIVTFRILVLVLPFAVSGVAFVIARALRAGTATGMGELTRADVRAGLSRPADRPDRDEHARLPPADEVIQLWRNPDGTWRWRWRGPDEELSSNEAYLNRNEALAAARTAFAGVRLERCEPPEDVLPPPRHRHKRLIRVAAAAAWLVLFLLGRRRPAPDDGGDHGREAKREARQGKG